MNEMFEQVLRTKLRLNHRPLNLCQIFELQKKARLYCYVEQSIKVMRMT